MDPDMRAATDWEAWDAAVTRAARAGYDRAIATLADVARRTGSGSAKYWADYLTADPDGLAPTSTDRRDPR